MKRAKAHDDTKAFEDALAAEPDAHYRLRLFVTGTTPRSGRAIQNIRAICEDNLQGRYDLEVIDIYQHPEHVKAEQIVVTPTLVKQPAAPAPQADRGPVRHRAGAGRTGYCAAPLSDKPPEDEHAHLTHGKFCWSGFGILQERLDEAEETLRALRSGEVDAIVASGPEGDQVYTLKGADETYRVMVQRDGGGRLNPYPRWSDPLLQRAVCRMLRSPLERVIGSRILDFVAPEDADIVSAAPRPERVAGKPKCD